MPAKEEVAREDGYLQASGDAVFSQDGHQSSIAGVILIQLKRNVGGLYSCSVYMLGAVGQARGLGDAEQQAPVPPDGMRLPSGLEIFPELLLVRQAAGQGRISGIA